MNQVPNSTRSDEQDTDIEGELLVWIYEKIEQDGLDDLPLIRTQLAKTFPHVSSTIMDRVFHEVMPLAALANFTDRTIVESDDVVNAQSFGHYKLPPKNDPDRVTRRGGIASIHRAVDLKFGRPVAIKLPLRPFLSDPEVCTRLRREAEICARLQHPCIVPVYELGEYEPEACPFFAMKYVDGTTLLSQLSDTGDNSHQLRLVNIFRQVCGALEYAHQQGVIHRDLKPENIMIGEFGEVHLLDWGFARSVTASLDCSRRSGAIDRFLHTAADGVFGTIAYMSPEQASGMSSVHSAKSDVFGLGGILCHILTGEPVYVADSSAEMLAMAKSYKIADALLRLARPSSPVALVEIASKCLEQNPELRPTASEVGKAIDDYLVDVQESRVRAERRAHHLSLGLAFSVLALIVTVAVFLANSAYQDSVIREESDAILAENAAWNVTGRVSEMRSFAAAWPIRTEEDIVAKTSLLTQSRSLADSAISVDAPIARSSEVAQRIDELKMQIQTDLKATDEDLRRLQRSAASVAQAVRFTESLRKSLLECDTLLLQDLFGGRLTRHDPKLDSHYRTVFANFDIDWDNQSADDISVQLGGLSVELRQEIALHLDYWLFRSGNSDSIVSKVRFVQDVIDGDDFRKELRSISAEDPSRELNQVSIAVEESLRSPASQLLLSLKYFQAGDVANSRRIASRSLFQFPDHLPTQAFAASLLIEMSPEYWQQAIPAIYRCHSIHQEAGPTLAILLAKENDVLQTESFMRSMSGTGPRTASSVVTESILRQRLGGQSQALELIQQARSMAPHSALVRLAEPVMLARCGRVNEALALIESGIAAFPEDNRFVAAKGLVATMNQDSHTALQALTSVSNAYPDSGAIVAWMAIGHLRQGHLSDALRDVEIACDKDPLSPMAHRAAAIVYLGDEKFESAEQHARRAIALGDHGADANAVLASLYLHRNDPSRGKDICESILSIDPHNALALACMAAISDASGDYESASKYALEAVAVEPSLASPWKVLFGASRRLSRNSVAVDAARHYLTLRPEKAEGHLALAELLEAAGKPSEATDVIRSAVRLFPENEQAVRILADILVRSGEGTAAEKILSDRANDPDRTSPEVCMMFATFLKEHNRQDEAVSAVRKAIQLFPDSASLLHELGELYVVTGNIDGAISAFSDAQRVADTSYSSSMKNSDGVGHGH